MFEKGKIRILFVLSKRCYDSTFAKENIFNHLNDFKDSKITIDILVDPPKQRLEEYLYRNNCICVISCCTQSIHTINDSKIILNRYNILKLLETLGVRHLGISYNKSLIFSDKTTYLHMLENTPKGRIVTRYQYEKTLKKQELKIFFPAYLEPICSQECFFSSVFRATTFEEGIAWISSVMTSDTCIDEIYIQQETPFDHRYSVILMGNPPLTLEIICEHKFNNEIEIISKTCEHQISQMLSTSYELFKKYALKDFAQFDYLYVEKEDKYYLCEINTQNILNNIVVHAIMQKYKIDFKKYIYLLLTIIFTDNNINNNTDVLKYLIQEVPLEIKDNLISLETKIQMDTQYNYEDVCMELSTRILRQDESNKYEVVRLMQRAFEKLPKPETPEALYLGNSQDNYSFLEEYSKIPLCPQNPEKILNTSIQILNGQMRWHNASMLYNVDPSIMFNTVVASAVTNLYNPSTMVGQYCAGYLDMEKQIAAQLSTLVGWDSRQSAGIFTPGGKICLSYAIKTGLNRCQKFSSSRKTPVVICSEINHFSIETVCYQLGIPKASCIRVPVDMNGTIDFEKYEDVLNKIIREKKPIACIVFSGGNTTHCSVENIKKGVHILRRTVDKWQMSYTPYVYYDLVVCWPWLFYKNYDFTKNPLSVEPIVLKKIEHVTRIISYSYLADGVGIDFHKCGFAPLTNSIFLNRTANELYSLTDTSVKDNQREPYHYTFCNSRGATDIISAWNILQSVGVEGFQAYVANMLTVANVFKVQLPKFDFEVLQPNNTYGFATILWTSFPTCNYQLNECIAQGTTVIQKNNEYLYQLTEYFKHEPNSGYCVRFLPNYTEISTGYRIAVVALLPMSLHIDKDKALQISNKIGHLKRAFDEVYDEYRTLSLETMPYEVPK